MVLQHDGVGEHAGHGLCVTIAAVHRQVEPERVAVLHVDVARFTSAQRVDTAIERFIRLDQNLDFGVAAVNAHCNIEAAF